MTETNSRNFCIKTVHRINRADVEVQTKALEGGHKLTFMKFIFVSPSLEIKAPVLNDKAVGYQVVKRVKPRAHQRETGSRIGTSNSYLSELGTRQYFFSASASIYGGFFAKSSIQNLHMPILFRLVAEDSYADAQCVRVSFDNAT